MSPTRKPTWPRHRPPSPDGAQAQAALAGSESKLQTTATLTLSPDVVQAQAALAGSESKLHTAHQNLDQLSAQLAQANADLGGQQSLLTASIKAADETCSKFGGSSGACATARADNEAKQAGLLKAQQSVNLLSGGGSWDQLQAQKDVLSAQADYDAAAASLKQLESAHSLNVDLIAAQTAYDTAVSAVTSARAKLDQTRAGPTTADQVTAQTAVDQARTGMTTAQAKLDQTIQGAQDADLVAAQTAVDTARANLDSAQAKLDTLGVATPQDVQAARSAQTSARAATR